jgi:signal peptidase I
MEDLRYHEIIDHLILEKLGSGEEITLRVSGKSMFPLMKQGDSIRIERCAPEVIGLGDIITFKRAGTYYTHRLLCVVKRGDGIRLITKGDSEINTDPPVPPDQVLGRVAAIQKKNRTLYLKTPFWRFMNRLFGVFSLVETFCIQSYRSAAGRLLPVSILVRTTMKPSLFYRQIKNRGLHMACFMLMDF